MKLRNIEVTCCTCKYWEGHRLVDKLYNNIETSSGTEEGKCSCEKSSNYENSVEALSGKCCSEWRPVRI